MNENLGSLADMGVGGTLAEGSMAAFGLLWLASSALTGDWL